MMSFRAVHAGAGYQYLLRSVATNDAYDPSTETGKLASYYQAKGTPPGRWLGSGLAGLNSETVVSGAVVEADQMSALYGMGMNPDTHEMIDAGASMDECKLGGKFPTFTKGSEGQSFPVLDALREAENALIKRQGKPLTDEQRSELAVGIGRKFYVEETGYVDAPDRDVIAWVNLQRDQTKQAVAGFDMTFSPVKSVSVLWALADEASANRIAAAHHEAVAEVIGWMETNIARTRMGSGGLAQVETRGIMAGEFTHFDTRAGDPDLHSHVLVSNKVQGPDGKWRTLDSRTLFKFHQTLSARYDAVLQEALTRTMGLAFEASSRGEFKEPVWEVAGVAGGVIELFSKRRRESRPVYEAMVDKYVADHGHQPDARTRKNLWQSAILDTRDAKAPARSLQDLRAQWRADVLAEERGQDYLASVDQALGVVHNDERPVFFDDGPGRVSAEMLGRAGVQIVDRMVQKRSYFSPHHVTAAVNTHLKGFRFRDADEADEAMGMVYRHIIDSELVSLNSTDPLSLPGALRRRDERGEVAIDRPIDYGKYATETTLRQEDETLQAVAEPVVLFADTELIDSVVERFEADNGFSLNAGQDALARHLLQTGTTLGVGVGPAGTGKTTSMQVVTRAWQETGRNVIGLAPSAAAAEVLGEEIGVACYTMDHLAFTWRGRNPNKPGRDLSALPVTISPGDMLLVDESGMATTDNIHALVEIARESGAIIRMIGDPQQLDAVGTGGLFSLLCSHSDPVELTDVMRFSHGNDLAQAEASVQLRQGETAAIDFYSRRGWLSGGTRRQMISEAVEAYLRDVKDGRNALVLASTNEDVDAMNALIRAQRIEDGEVDDSSQVRLAHGEAAGLGDVIIARQNRRLAGPDGGLGHKIHNGQMFRIHGIHEDGSLLVEDVAKGLRVDLPADYVAQFTHLGYASTVHRAQGSTVDVTHAVIDGSTGRAGLYVGLTRGKKENRVYAVTDEPVDELAEDGHYHSAGNKAGLDAKDVFARAITRDSRQKSATEIRLEAEDYAGSRERVEKLYRYGLEQAYADFTDRHLDGFLSRIDADEITRLDEQGIQRVRTAWVDLLSQGVDPCPLMATATFNLHGAEDVGAVIAWRLQGQVPEPEGSVAEVAPPPPLTRGGDAELMDWLGRTRASLLASIPDEAPDERLDQAREVATDGSGEQGDTTQDADYEAFLRGGSLVDLTAPAQANGPVEDDRDAEDIDRGASLLDLVNPSMPAEMDPEEREL